MYSYTEVKDLVEKGLALWSVPASPPRLYEPIRYLLAIGGKRFRPCLSLLTANLFTERIEACIPPALAMEVFHNFTLMHDDIIDHAPVRRGQQTVHEKWDINTAILSGDVMLVKAYVLLCSLETNKLIPALAIFNKTAIEVCEGQQSDVDFEKRNDVTIDEYLHMITLKTGVLLGCSAYIGALAGGGTEEDAQHLYTFGKHLGISFQLQDDLLDAFGDADMFGKKTGGDITQNKKTFLWITLQQKLNETDRVLFGALHNEKDERQKVRQIIDLYKKYDIQQETENLMLQYYDSAISALQKTKVTENKISVLMHVAEAIYQRKF
ncbi:MAG: polyprenyl synthetase family protein [Chitinophagales bacterium]|nr:polyprenyl synthetase family protein [Chitinophagales bacterium]